MNLTEYPDIDFLHLRLADKIAAQLGEFIRRDGHATLCVPGGTTPAPVFDILSGVDLDWGLVSVLLNDERWVGEDSDRSNAALLRAHLLRGNAAKARFIPMYLPGHATPETALPELSAQIGAHLPISVLLVGMGADMHTASLFPSADRLAEALAPDAPPLMPMRAEAAVEPRVTLTAPVLRDAMHIHLMITGAAKRAAVEKALHLPPEEAPIRILLDQAEVHWAA